MPDMHNIALSPEELYRLNYEEYANNHWSDIDGFVKIFMLEDETYQQYVLDDKDEEVIIGIPLRTAANLQLRYLSMTGYELKRWDGDTPQTAQ
jgi:hypothetical protein